MAKAVVDGLVGEQGVQHERPGPQAGLEPGGHGFRGVRARRGRARAARQRGFERRRRAVEVDGDARHLLFEQALPCAAAGHRLLRQDHLLGLGEEVRAIAALGPQVVPGECEAVVGEQGLDLLVGQVGPLEVEEEELRVDRGRALLDPLHPRAAAGSDVSVANSRPAKLPVWPTKSSSSASPCM